MRRHSRVLVLVTLTLGCSGPTVPSSDPPPAPRELAIACDRLAPCDPGLGVCLRCERGDDPSWMWSDAPGSPRALRVRPDLLGSPEPDITLALGHPFFDHGPDCRRFAFDERGMPRRTIPAPGEQADAHEWAYDERGRVIEARIDRQPFCVANDFGDEAPCGTPDGEWDEVIAFAWSELADGGSIVRWPGGERRFDASGRLVRAVSHDGQVTERAYREGRLTQVSSSERTMTFAYDAGHLTELRRQSSGGPDHVLRWERDPRGNAIGLIADGAEVATYDNRYDGELLRAVCSDWPGRSPRVLEHTREHDARGLLVREVIGEPGLRVITELVWTRDARGVPASRNGADYRCLAPLADRFASAER